MRTKKLLKILGLGVAMVVILVLLFVGAFIYNPFEGDLPDVRDLVPRSSHFFVRKVDLADDFDTFPEPRFWAELSGDARNRRVLDRLRSGPTWSDLRAQGIERQIGRLRTAVEQVARDSGGTLDLMDDLIGREVVVAGRYSDFEDRPLREPWVCAFLRVSWKVRFAWGLMHWGMVQDMAAENGVQVAADGEFLKVDLPSGEQVWLDRRLDCLMVSTGREFLGRVRAILDGEEGFQAIGQAAEYIEAVDNRLDDWEEEVDVAEANAVEFSMRPNELPFFRRFASEWPDPSAEDSMNERVLASFLRLSGWNFVNGAFTFVPPAGRSLGSSFGVMAQVKLDSNDHTPFQSKFFRAEPRPRDEWLEPFLDMVPEDACAAAALRMPPRDFLEEMHLAMDPNDRQLLDDQLRHTGKYDGIRDLIQKVEIAMRPRTGFIFRKNRPEAVDPQSDVPPPVVAQPSPVPQIAWVFWMDPALRKRVEELIRTLQAHRSAFLFDNVVKLDLNLGGTGRADFTNAAWEFYHKGVPGTGEVAFLIWDRFFVMSNSGPLIKDMMQTQFRTAGKRPVRVRRDFDLFMSELPDVLNGFVYLNGPRLVEVLEDYEQHVEKATAATPDPVWMARQRSVAEEEVRRRQFSQYGSVAGIPESVRPQFEEAVRSFLQQRWAEAHTEFSAADRAAIEEAQAFLELVEGAHFYVRFEPTLIDLTGRVLFDY